MFSSKKSILLLTADKVDIMILVDIDGGMAVRAKILHSLRTCADGYLSGEELCRQLNISRTAVWKHIRILKEAGYEIEAHPRKGYRLNFVPDRLLPEEVNNWLRTKFVGREIRYLISTESTNNEAKKLAAANFPEGTIVLAEEQLNGRGRLARGWFSPPNKGIWLSVILRPPFSPYDAPKCTLMAAVAVTNAVRKVTSVHCGIKWPNDILYQEKKMVGILTEMSAEMDAINYVVIGMGINVNISKEEFPEELKEIATSVAMAAGKNCCRAQLLAAILEELEVIYQEVKERGFAKVLTAWREMSVTLGQTVHVTGGKQGFTGVAEDIDEEGALLVKTSEGIKRVLAGDVSIRFKR
jgi:BirA family biotin operon repressor/biotin-[acetyl-CoA-carboxylase] ligase